MASFYGSDLNALSLLRQLTHSASSHLIVAEKPVWKTLNGLLHRQTPLEAFFGAQHYNQLLCAALQQAHTKCRRLDFKTRLALKTKLKKLVGL